MLRRALVAASLIAAGCTTTAPRHAETFLKRGHVFQGEKHVEITGSEDDVQGMGRALLGVSIAKVSEGARYVLEISGVCNVPAAVGYFRSAIATDYRGVPVPGDPALKVEVFDNANGDRVFSAHLSGSDGCPEIFFADVARAINRNWPGPSATEGEDSDQAKRR